MYRPDGWNNPYLKPKLSREMFTRNSIYEAGADAMLEALKAEGKYHNYLPGQMCKAIGLDYKTVMRGGWIVLIPEEGE